MIVTPYYSYKNTPMSYKAGTSGAAMLGLGAAAFGMGYLHSMKPEEKLAAQNKIRAIFGLPPKTPVAPAAPSAPAAPATPQAPDPLGESPTATADPSQLSGNGGIASNPDSERLDTSGISSVPGSGDGGYADSWNANNDEESAPSSVPPPVNLAAPEQPQP